MVLVAQMQQCTVRAEATLCGESLACTGTTLLGCPRQQQGCGCPNHNPQRQLQQGAISKSTVPGQSCDWAWLGYRESCYPVRLGVGLELTPPDRAQVFLRQTKSKVADPSGSGYSDLEEWVLDTEGVNLAEVLSPPCSCWIEGISGGKTGYLGLWQQA